jgi:Zn-dependent M32 family carboxypeptidase
MQEGRLAKVHFNTARLNEYCHPFYSLMHEEHINKTTKYGAYSFDQAYIFK